MNMFHIKVHVYKKSQQISMTNGIPDIFKFYLFIKFSVCPLRTNTFNRVLKNS